MPTEETLKHLDAMNHPTLGTRDLGGASNMGPNSKSLQAEIDALKLRVEALEAKA